MNRSFRFCMPNDRSFDTRPPQSRRPSVQWRKWPTGEASPKRLGNAVSSPILFQNVHMSCQIMVRSIREHACGHIMYENVASKYKSPVCTCARISNIHLHAIVNSHGHGSLISGYPYIHACIHIYIYTYIHVWITKFQGCARKE